MSPPICNDFEQGIESKDWEAALAHYGGGFLHAFSLPHCKPFEFWTDRQRAHVARLHRVARRARIAELLGGHDAGAALAVARRWVELEPLEDEAQHKLIELLAASGERAEALREAENYERLLHEDGLQPLEETKQLVERIRAGEAIALANSRLALTDRERAAEPTRSRRRLSILIVAAAVVAGFFVIRAFSQSTAPVARRLAVLPLENRTGDPEADDLGEYAADWIARWIDLAGPIDVIPASTVRDAIRALGSSNPGPPSAAAVAKRIAASHIVTGSVARIGGSTRFEIEFVDARTDQRLHALDPVLAPADSLDGIIDRLAQRAAAAAIVLLQPAARLSWTGGYTVPPTIEMYRDYLATFELFCQERYQDVITMRDRVLERSTGFVPVMALVRIAYWNLGAPPSQTPCTGSWSGCATG